jgi:hypothetical protein
MADTQIQTGSGNSAVPIVAIIAIGALVLFFAWFFLIRGGTTQTSPTQTQPGTAPPAKSDSDVNIKVDLPDSVTIK